KARDQFLFGHHVAALAPDIEHGLVFDLPTDWKARWIDDKHGDDQALGLTLAE
ncbi:MAG: hypothetical protein JJ849_13050, partial [Rhizobiales bacterium]|nr:hypothetical protein [Hyphomicrobiales bacterium]